MNPEELSLSPETVEGIGIDPTVAQLLAEAMALLTI